MAMKKIDLIILLLLLLNNFTLKCQQLSYYDMSISAAYLPGCGSRSESYSLNDSKLQHKGTKRSWKSCKSFSKFSLKKDSEIEQTIRCIDSLYNLNSFIITVPQSLIDSMKTRTTWHTYLGISATDIDNFFTNGNTVTLKMDEIKNDGMEGVVIDGIYFVFDLKFKTDHSDTVKHSFYGNFMDNVSNSNIRYWLSLYLAYKKHPFFSSISLVKEYFSDEQFEGILFRYIVGRKKK